MELEVTIKTREYFMGSCGRTLNRHEWFEAPQTPPFNISPSNELRLNHLKSRMSENWSRLDEVMMEVLKTMKEQQRQVQGQLDFIKEIGYTQKD